MGQIVPAAVEQHLAALNGQSDPILLDIARTGDRDDLPRVDAEVGVLLRVLVLATRATRVLEIGTAIGYSGVWMAGALPKDGMLITMESDEQRARQARENFTRAGLDNRVNVIVGDAQRMLHKVAGPFDLIFQDGDRKLYDPMLERLIGLLRPGGLLVTNNEIHNHPSLLTSLVPLRDGVAISVKR